MTDKHEGHTPLWNSTKKVFWILVFGLSLSAIVSSVATMLFHEVAGYVFAVMFAGLFGMWMFYNYAVVEKVE